MIAVYLAAAQVMSRDDVVRIRRNRRRATVERPNIDCVESLSVAKACT